MEDRPLGTSGLRLPVVGMGTWRTFDVTQPDEIEHRRRIVDCALERGTTLFDTSPMYGAAERVLGMTLADRRDRVIVADKIWTADDAAADAQVQRALEYYAGRVDIYQVHNLVAWERRLDTLERLHSVGQVTSIGVTHYQHSAFGELMRIMRSGRITCIQIPYNATDRVVEREVLPLAAELQIGVLVMRPLGAGALAAHAPSGEALQPLERFNITTWAQALLKWVLSDARVTAVLPATTRLDHVLDNTAAGEPPWFGADERAYVTRLAEQL